MVAVIGQVISTSLNKPEYERQGFRRLPAMFREREEALVAKQGWR
jgi:hypothetical protein